MTREARKPTQRPSGHVCFDAFVGIGSNVDPEENILSALPAIGSRVQVLATSCFYRNPALSPDGRKQPPFVNGVLRIRTQLSPSGLKHGVLRAIEARMGRRRTGDRYGPRPLDLDLLVYENFDVASEGLELPDPDISVQPFWAVPLAELIPEFRTPNVSLPLRELARTFDTRAFVCLEAFTAEVRRTLGLIS